MAFSIQQLTDDSKFSQALRFEVLEQLCPRELVSDLLSRCHAWGERERSLNQLLIVYYVIALSLFRRLNLQVHRLLTTLLDPRASLLPSSSSSAIMSAGSLSGLLLREP